MQPLAKSPLSRIVEDERKKKELGEKRQKALSGLFGMYDPKAGGASDPQPGERRDQGDIPLVGEQPPPQPPPQPTLKPMPYTPEEIAANQPKPPRTVGSRHGKRLAPSAAWPGWPDGVKKPTIGIRHGKRPLEHEPAIEEDDPSDPRHREPLEHEPAIEEDDPSDPRHREQPEDQTSSQPRAFGEMLDNARNLIDRTQQQAPPLPPDRRRSRLDGGQFPGLDSIADAFAPERRQILPMPAAQFPGMGDLMASMADINSSSRRGSGGPMGGSDMSLKDANKSQAERDKELLAAVKKIKQGPAMTTV